MLELIFEQRRALAVFSSDHVLPSFNCDEWDYIQKLVLILKPFHDLTNDASGNEACISIVIPSLKVLDLYISRLDEPLLRIKKVFTYFVIYKMMQFMFWQRF